MSRARLYTGIYVALMSLAIGKVVFFEMTDLYEWWGYSQALIATMIAATVKSWMVVWYFQHLKWEPRSVKFVMGMGVFAVFLLTVAATFSLAQV